MTLDNDLNSFLGDLWLEYGLMEHASVASFAKFMLQAISLGAPPDILNAASQAAMDEVNHAKLCFKIAHSFSGRECGPGKMNIGIIDINETEKSLLTSVITEGCINETIAVEYAVHAKRKSVNPIVSSALSCIITDERRHSQLAYDFVKWMVETRPHLKGHVQDTFTAVYSVEKPVEDEVAPDEAQKYGFVPAELKSQIWKIALRDIIPQKAMEIVQ